MFLLWMPNRRRRQTQAPYCWNGFVAYIGRTMINRTVLLWGGWNYFLIILTADDEEGPSEFLVTREDERRGRSQEITAVKSRTLVAGVRFLFREFALVDIRVHNDFLKRIHFMCLSLYRPPLCGLCEMINTTNFKLAEEEHKVTYRAVEGSSLANWRTTKVNNMRRYCAKRQPMTSG